MPISDAQALEVAMQLIEASQTVSLGVAMHLEETPELDPESKELLEMCSDTIGMMAKVIAKSMETIISQEETAKAQDALLTILTGI